MKVRLQALGLLERAMRATGDDELMAAVEALDDDHREALERVVEGEPTPGSIRAAASKGRLSGAMESVALVLTDASLADCIEQLGEQADNPTSDQLREILPGVIERHGLALTRMMLAATVAGEAAAANVIRDLLKHDDVVQLPKEEPRPVAVTNATAASDVDATDPERDALRERRQEARRRKQEAAAQRRVQSARARGRT